jgi:hypothetical protein
MRLLERAAKAEGEFMDLEPGMTKQGVRDLNSLGPRKKKPNAADGQRGEGGGEPARVPEQPVAEAAAVASTNAPTPS